MNSAASALFRGLMAALSEFYVNIVCCALSTLVVQFFYAWRIWTISQKGLIIPGLVVSCAIAQLCECSSLGDSVKGES